MREAPVPWSGSELLSVCPSPSTTVGGKRRKQHCCHHVCWEGNMDLIYRHNQVRFCLLNAQAGSEGLSPPSVAVTLGRCLYPAFVLLLFVPSFGDMKAFGGTEASLLNEPLWNVGASLEARRGKDGMLRDAREPVSPFMLCDSPHLRHSL